MLGHGCPPRLLLLRAISARRESLRAAGFWLARLLVAVVLLSCFAPLALAVDSSQWHVRINWSCDQPAGYHGTLSIPGGEIVSVTSLATETDSPGAIRLADSKTVQVAPRLMRTHDGCDLVVRGKATDKIEIDLAAAGRESIQLEVPLSELLEHTYQKPFQRGAVQFSITRLANDTIRVVPRGRSLVFSPGDQIATNVVVAHLPGKPQAATLHVRLQDAAGAELWNREEELRFGGNDESDGVDVSFAAPKEPGIYEVLLSVFPKRAIPLPRRTAAAKRRVQFIVVDARPPTNESSSMALRDVRTDEGTVLGEIDLANPRWWERIARLPTSKVFVGSRNGPVASGTTSILNHEGIDWLGISPGQWQACPLPVGKATGPLVLELALAPNLPADVGIAIVEPNGGGESPTLLCERRIQIDDWHRLDDSQPHRVRIPFWPGAKGTWVLLTNRDSNKNALIGKMSVRVAEGMAATPAGNDGRTAWLFVERPWLARDMSAPDVIDPTTKRVVDDWNTWRIAAERLVDHVKRSGANGAVITLAADGGSLFPCDALAPSPRLERSASGDASDPVRKDILELLLRTFDREGLRLIPAITFNGTLPGAERKGMSGVPSEGGRYYDPLDPEWQKSVRDVLIEVAKNYGRHPSFSGIALNLQRDVPLCFISTDEGAETPVGLEFAANRWEASEDGVANEPTSRRRAWHAWRARKHARWLASLAREVQSHAPSARLLPALRTEVLVSATQRPEGVAMSIDDQALMAAGWFPDEADAPLRWIIPPQNVDPFDLGDAHSGSGESASFAMGDLRPTMILNGETWESKNPFGAMKSHSYVASQAVAVGSQARRSLAVNMASLDQEEWFFGGGIVPLGDQSEVRPALLALRNLPPMPLSYISPEDADQTRLAVIRSGEADGYTYWSLINAAPWPQDFSIEFASGQGFVLERLGDGAKLETIDESSGVNNWTARLQGYEIITLRAEGSHILERWSARSDEKTGETLRQWVRDVRQRLPNIRDPHAIDVISNAGFETPALKGMPPGWAISEGAHVGVEIDDRGPYEGKQSLHLINRTPKSDPTAVAWIRSSDFEPPPTRRIAVTVWMRTASDNAQPTVRIAFDGRYQGRGYYRWANVGKSEDGSASNPLSTQWKKYVFALEGLPEQGLSDLQVGFDLIGPGEVWIDHVELFDVWVNEREFDHLTRSAALAELQIERGHYDHCCRFLASPWPDFLRRSGGIKREPDDAQSKSASAGKTPAKTSNRPGMMERFKGLVPRLKRK